MVFILIWYAEEVAVFLYYDMDVPVPRPAPNWSWNYVFYELNLLEEKVFWITDVLVFFKPVSSELF